MTNMTTQMKFRLLVLIAVLFMGNNSFSQTLNVKNLPISVSNLSYEKTYSEVLTKFQTLFPNAENVRFYNIDKNTGATFKMNDLRYRVLLNKKGNLLVKITYGQEKHLPVEVRKAIKMEYIDFRITAASLVEEANRKIWVVHLEDDWEYVVVRAENNEVNENMAYKKR